MKVALVHDYLKEYGGAERVLEALTEIYPEAPIYTAFMVKNSAAGKAFAGKKIITSWANWFLPFKNLYSPLRFLIPLIWESFDFREFDIVISSASWYITKSILTSPETLHICYCHTPPRWLYGYQTAVEWKRFLPIRVYGEILAFFLRKYDFLAAQRVDEFIANSKNTRQRIKKFYRRDSTVIYPPVSFGGSTSLEVEPLKERYFLCVSRLSGAKNIDLAISACSKLGENLWIVGSGQEEQKLRSLAGPTIRFLGQVSDSKLWDIYRGCQALIATAQDEDFGITPVEAMASGRPVIAFRGGGYLESVIEGKTGVFFNEPTVESLTEAIKQLSNLAIKPEDCRNQAKKFSKERFKREIREFVENK
ncbi:MAG: glycosyltransferase [Patescibacteria group bacterium]